MAEFKSMVKMYTDEPSVILKLKKGGKVAVKKADGHKSMSTTMNPRMRGADEAFESESGQAPKKPSIIARQRAMNPNLYKKGGKVAKAGMVAPMGAPAQAMGPAALAAMDPAARMARAAMVRRALTGMKKGGSADHAAIKKLERELHHHESLPAAKAHKASGGEIDAAETRTTIKGNVGKYAKTKVDTAHRDTASGTKGVREGVPGGYKRGGRANDCYAMGGSIEGNEGPYENTKMVTAGRGKTGGTTGGVRMSNAGGYKRGGKACYASGGEIDAKLTRTTVEGGNWENRAANTAKPGKTNTRTGEVKEANAGGYRRGGSASKKAYATGGNVVDDGKATKMPRHFVSRPVANSLQSGTFKRGGKVRRFEDGGSMPLDIENQLKDMQAEEDYKAYKRWKEREGDRDRANIFSAMKGAADWASDLFKTKPPAGSVTKTRESTTVSPARKRGGRIKKFDWGGAVTGSSQMAGQQAPSQMQAMQTLARRQGMNVRPPMNPAQQTAQTYNLALQQGMNVTPPQQISNVPGQAPIQQVGLGQAFGRTPNFAPNVDYRPIPGVQQSGGLPGNQMDAYARMLQSMAPMGQQVGQIGMQGQIPNLAVGANPNFQTPQQALQIQQMDPALQAQNPYGMRQQILSEMQNDQKIIEQQQAAYQAHMQQMPQLIAQRQQALDSMSPEQRRQLTMNAQVFYGQPLQNDQQTMAQIQTSPQSLNASEIMASQKDAMRAARAPNAKQAERDANRAERDANRAERDAERMARKVRTRTPTPSARPAAQAIEPYVPGRSLNPTSGNLMAPNGTSSPRDYAPYPVFGEPRNQKRGGAIKGRGKR